MLKFRKTTQEEMLAVVNVKKRYGKRTRVNQSELLVAFERVGNFTICVLQREKELFSGASVINGKDLKSMRRGEIRMTQKTGDMHALAKAVKNMLDIAIMPKKKKKVVKNDTTN